MGVAIDAIIKITHTRATLIQPWRMTGTGLDNQPSEPSLHFGSDIDQLTQSCFSRNLNPTGLQEMSEYAVSRQPARASQDEHVHQANEYHSYTCHIYP